MYRALIYQMRLQGDIWRVQVRCGCVHHKRITVSGIKKSPPNPGAQDRPDRPFHSEWSTYLQTSKRDFLITQRIQRKELRCHHKRMISKKLTNQRTSLATSISSLDCLIGPTKKLPDTWGASTNSSWNASLMTGNFQCHWLISSR